MTSIDKQSLDVDTDLERDGVHVVPGGADVHHHGAGDDLCSVRHLPDAPGPLTSNTEPRPALDIIGGP